jgi:enoyl-CoA hydratase/carnithine racemase
VIDRMRWIPHPRLTGDRAVVAWSAEGICKIALNRPRRRNAIDREMAQSLQEALQWFISADEIRAGLLVGDESAFCSGGDISMFAAFTDSDGADFTRRGYDILRPVELSAKPLIAAVRGYCLAGGLEVALACDFIVAADDAQFGFGELDLGLIPGWGGTARICRAIPIRRARQLVLTSERLTGQQARDLGLVNECMPADEVLARAEALAQRLAACPPDAVEAAQNVMRLATLDEHFDAALTQEHEVAGRLFNGESTRDKVSQWLESATRRGSRRS